MRVCRNRTGPEESSRTATAIAASTGLSSSSATRQTSTSNVRFAAALPRLRGRGLRCRGGVATCPRAVTCLGTATCAGKVGRSETEATAVLPFYEHLTDELERFGGPQPGRCAVPSGIGLEGLVGARVRERLHLAAVGLLVCAHRVQLPVEGLGDVDVDVRREHGAWERRGPLG